MPLTSVSAVLRHSKYRPANNNNNNNNNFQQTMQTKRNALIYLLITSKIILQTTIFLSGNKYVTSVRLNILFDILQNLLLPTIC